MGLIINTSDFVGQWAIAQNSYSQLSNYITQFERQYLYKLLGKELADLFITDLSNYIPQTTRFDNIYNAINEEINGCYMSNGGMKNMMLGFIYFEFQRYDKAKATIAGTFANQNENQREVGFTELNIWNRYNDAISSFKVIQEYCLADDETYPEFIGTELGYSHWSI